MWLLITGTLLITAALLVRWRFLPKEILWEVGEAPVSLHTPTELVVRVPDTVSYSVSVRFYRHNMGYPAASAAESVYQGHLPGNAVSPAVCCSVYENGQPVALEGYAGVAPGGDDARGTAGSFNGEAGHTYTITATVPRPTDTLAKMTPRLEIGYDMIRAKENMVARMIIILPTGIVILIGAMLAVVGGILMYRASSR